MTKLIVYAHRGASGYTIENTIPSFELAISMHADAVEFDVQLTFDENVIVFHDFTLTRLFNVSAGVSNLTVDEIKRYTLKNPMDGTFVGIPLLDELLSRISHRIPMNVELKSKDDDVHYIETLCTKVFSLINNYKIVKDVIVSSFNINALRQMRKLSKDIRLALLVDRLSDNYSGINGLDFYIGQAKELNAEAINMSYIGVTHEIIKSIHDKGFKVNIYTINDETLITDILKNGVDGIFTNYPDKIIKMLNRISDQKNML